MELLVHYLRNEVKELHENKVRILTLGDISKLPQSAQDEIQKARTLTEENKGLTVCIALNYGSRNEMIQAVRNIAESYKNEDISTLDEIDEECFGNHLYTAQIPDPDLMIRTSGEVRISNFLLWQLAYSELWFTDKYWPEFKSEDLVDAVLDFQNRNRRFGGV